MRVCVVIRGPAGVGKSTIAAKLAKRIGAAHVDIDLIKHMISSKSSPQRTHIAHATGRHFTMLLLRDGFDVVVEEVLRQEDLAALLKDLRKEKIAVVKVFLTASLTTLLRRDAGRVKNKGRGVISRLSREVVPTDELILDTARLSANQCVRRIQAEIRKSNG